MTAEVLLRGGKEIVLSGGTALAQTAVPPEPTTTRCRQTTRTARHLASTSVPLAVPPERTLCEPRCSPYFAWGCFAKSNSKPLSFKVMISTSGSGQMQPLPMNEFLQDNLKQACGVNVELDAVDWSVVFNAVRLAPDSPGLHGAMALNFSSGASDVSMMARFLTAAYFSPNGFNFSHWKDHQLEAELARLAVSTDSASIDASYRAAHERLVDNVRTSEKEFDFPQGQANAETAPSSFSRRSATHFLVAQPRVRC